jgi:hypothetical protein
MSKQSESKATTSKPIYKKPAFIISGIIGMVVAVLVITNMLSKKEGTDTEYMFKKEGELTFTDSLGAVKTKIDIEIANSDFDRQLGLMFRRHMDSKDGMLFIFPSEEMQAFWMRNTFIPLDMVFVNAEKKIVTIHRNTQTLSDQSYPSSAPAMYVIEVTGGFCSNHNIIEGDRINFIQLAEK